MSDRDEGFDVKFVLLTAGFKTIPESTLIGEQFDRVYGENWTSTTTGAS